MSAKFYQNGLGFIEDMTKTFWSVFFGSQCRSVANEEVVYVKRTFDTRSYRFNY